jgi:polyhydroxybutyrate depolymerase
MPPPIPRRIPCLALLLLLVAGGFSPAYAGEYQLTHEGIERTYDLYVPSSYRDASTAPVPLVLVLHGRSSSSRRMADITGFNTRAEQHGFIVAYPEGLDQAWNYVHDIPGYQPGPDDPDFLVKLVSVIGERYNIDIDRVYVTGISNGGFMAQRMACYAPSQFAAFASVAAGGYGAMPRRCKSYRPVNILYIQGTEDSLVPWRGLRINGQDGQPQQVTMSITDSLKFWSQRNRCAAEVVDRELVQQGNSPGTSVRVLSARDCEGEAEVTLYAILGGGHNWPGSRGVIPPRVAGRVNMDIHASDVIWAFFQRHERVE